MNYYISNLIKEPFEIKRDKEHFENKDETIDFMKPEVWGNIFWHQLHIMSFYYPINASPIVRQRIKNRILALPYELPCDKCRVHCSDYVENADLDKAVESRNNLSRFFVDFHNAVNKRLGKPVWTYEQALKYYLGIKEHF